jgi:hypothetical protein
MMTSLPRTQQTDTLFRRSIGVMLVLLVIQYLSGMVLNLYVTLPPTHPGTGESYAPSIPWALAGGAGIVLAIHVATWLCLTAGGILVLLVGILRRRGGGMVGASLGLLSLLVAASGGLTFLNRGGANSESLIMALGFLAAFVTYALTGYVARER